MNKPKLAIFASGTGTNFIAIAEAITQGDLFAEIVLVVCDKQEAPVIAKANKYQIPVFLFDVVTYQTKADYEQEILQQLKQSQAELLVLAGFMRLLGPTLLDAYPQKIINIHPSLLPKYKGKDAIKKAYEANELINGVTIHYVDAGMDTGQIIAQASFTRTPEMTLAEVETKIHELEHNLFPQTLKKLLNEKEYQKHEKKSIN